MPIVASVRSEASQQIDEDLEELDLKLKRLRVEYDQYFMGGMRREPVVLRGDVQRTITKYVSEPPRNSTQKFKFNTLCARFQSYRALWGRTLREIEAGTFRKRGAAAVATKAAAAPEEAEAAKAAAAPEPDATPDAPPTKRSAVDQLYQALAKARSRTGEKDLALDRQKLEELVRKQTETLRREHPGARVSFKVVVENNRAKLKASVKKS
jgi:hypothetical protein